MMDYNRLLYEYIYINKYICFVSLSMAAHNDICCPSGLTGDNRNRVRTKCQSVGPVVVSIIVLL